MDEQSRRDEAGIKAGQRALSLDQAARYLGVGRTTLKRHINAGDVPSYKLGNRRLIPLRWVQEVLGEIPEELPVEVSVDEALAVLERAARDSAEVQRFLQALPRLR